MSLIFDIETGSNERANKYLEPFDKDNPKHIRYGNLKDPVKKGEMARIEEAIYYKKAKDAFPLHPVTGKILVMGTSLDGKHELDYLREGVDEKMILENFWNKVADSRVNGYPIVGFKIKTFDLPFIIRRSWINRVTPYPLMTGRWWEEWIIDLYDVWTLSLGKWEGNSDYVRNRLVDISEVLGIGTKEQESSANFEKIFINDLPKALNHADNDLTLTDGLFNILSDFVRIKEKKSGNENFDLL
jgi:hypothetical protein